MKYVLVLLSLSLFTISCASKNKEEAPSAPAELTEVKQEAEAVQPQTEEPASEPVKKVTSKGKRAKKKTTKTK